MQQERVAAGSGVTRGRERGIDDGIAELPGQELGRRRSAQGARAHGHRRQVAGQLTEDRRVGRPFRRPQRRGDEHREAVETMCQVGQEAQRRTVAPLEIVDQDRERAVGRQVGREPVEAVQGGERRVVRPLPVVRLGDDAEDVACGGRRTGQGELLRDAVDQDRLEELPHDAEGNARSRALLRAVNGRKPAAAALRRTSDSSRDLPIPAGPSRSRTTPPPPATWRTAASSAAISLSRSRSSGGDMLSSPGSVSRVDGADRGPCRLPECHPRRRQGRGEINRKGRSSGRGAVLLALFPGMAAP